MAIVCGTAGGAFLAECPPRQSCDTLATVAVETLPGGVGGTASNGTVQALTCGCSRTWHVVGATCSNPTWGAWVSLGVCVLMITYCLWLSLQLIRQLLQNTPTLLQALMSPPASPRGLGYALSSEGETAHRSGSGGRHDTYSAEDSGHQYREGRVGHSEHMGSTQHLAQMAAQHGMGSTRGLGLLLPGQAPLVSLRATTKYPASFILLTTVMGIICLALYGVLPLVPLALFHWMLMVLEALNILVAVFQTMALLRIMLDVLLIARRMRFVHRHIHGPMVLCAAGINLLTFFAHCVWGVSHVVSELLVLLCSVSPLFLFHYFSFKTSPSSAVHPNEAEAAGERDARPGLRRQESASDFWRRRLFVMARDRLAHVLPPIAVVMTVSFIVTLLYMGVINRGIDVPVHVPMAVLAWARLVLAVQIIKLRSIVRAPKAAAAAATARLQAIQRQLSRRQSQRGRRRPLCVRLCFCLAGLVGDAVAYLVWMLNPVDDYNSAASSTAVHRQGSSARGLLPGGSGAAFVRTLQLPFSSTSRSHASSTMTEVEGEGEGNGCEPTEHASSTGSQVMSTSRRLQQMMSNSGRLRQMLSSSGRSASEGMEGQGKGDGGLAAVDEEEAAAHYVFTTIMSRNQDNLSAIFESRASESSSRNSSMGSEHDSADPSVGVMNGLVNELQRID